MATKLNTRILLRYDSYEAWSTQIPVLRAGEGAIAVPGDMVGSVETAAACLMKVGNGSKHFNELPWLSAIAADVHTWAKKPASEFMTWHKDDDNGPKLATKAEVEAVASRVSFIESALNTEGTGLKARMTAAETDIDNLQALVSTGEDGLACKLAALTQRVTDVESVNTNQNTAIEEITKENTGKIAVAVKAEQERAMGVEGGLRTDVDTIKGDYLKAADKTELSNLIALETTNRGSAISGLKNELTAEINKKADATALNDYYTKTEADAEFMTESEVDARINTLIVGSDPEGGKTIENIQNLVKYVDENAGQIAGLITTVGDHTDALSGIAGNITNLQNADIAINNKIGDAGDVALGSGETILGRISANDTAAQGYATEAYNDAQDYIDGLVEEINGAAEDLASVVSGHSTLLAGIEGTTVKATIEAAQQAAEQKVTDLANGQVKTNKEAIAAINDAENGILATAKAYTDTEVEEVASALAGEKSAREAFDKTALTGALGEADDEGHKPLTIKLDGTELDLIFICGGANV